MQRYYKTAVGSAQSGAVVEAEQFKSAIPALTTAFNSGHPDNRHYTGVTFLHLPVLVDEFGPHLVLIDGTGAVRISPGDWLVKDGDKWRAVAQEAFDKNYKPALITG